MVLNQTTVLARIVLSEDAHFAVQGLPSSPEVPQ